MEGVEHRAKCARESVGKLCRFWNRPGRITGAASTVAVPGHRSRSGKHRQHHRCGEPPQVPPAAVADWLTTSPTATASSVTAMTRKPLRSSLIARPTKRVLLERRGAGPAQVGALVPSPQRGPGSAAAVSNRLAQSAWPCPIRAQVGASHGVLPVQGSVGRFPEKRMIHDGPANWMLRQWLARRRQNWNICAPGIAKGDGRAVVVGGGDRRGPAGGPGP